MPGRPGMQTRHSDMKWYTLDVNSYMWPSGYAIDAMVLVRYWCTEHRAYIIQHWDFWPGIPADFEDIPFSHHLFLIPGYPGMSFIMSMCCMKLLFGNSIDKKVKQFFVTFQMAWRHWVLQGNHLTRTKHYFTEGRCVEGVPLFQLRLNRREPLPLHEPFVTRLRTRLKATSEWIVCSW